MVDGQTPLKLLVVMPSINRGGTEEYALKMATASVRKGWKVHVAFPKTEGTDSLVKDFSRNQIQYHCLKIHDSGNDPNYKALIIYCLQFIRTFLLLIRIRPDVILMNLPWPNFSLGAILAFALLEVPTLVVFHLIPYHFGFGSLKLKAYTWSRVRNQQWLAISEHGRKLICESFQIPLNEVLRIYNGVSIQSASANGAHIDFSELKTQVRQELGLSNTQRLVLTVGRLEPQKGYEDLITPISELAQEFPDLRFIWVGEGTERQTLFDRLREYGVEEQVLFLGYRSDVAKLMRSADLFVFPTHYEGLPLALLEAMSNCLPVVSSDASSIPEIIEHEVHGLLFSTGNSSELLERLRYALRHPEQMLAMSRRAEQRVQDFSEEKMLTETLNIILSLGCL
jgi:glycosyltransferase involved in cell wall biosynthesis